jgi:hypothetical protein
MDREWGSKPGGGGAASAQNEAIDRRERLRRLAMETIDLAKDPYFMRNHLGRYSLPFRRKTLDFPLSIRVAPPADSAFFCPLYEATSANFV